MATQAEKGARLVVAADGDALKAAVAKHILASAKAAIAARGRFTLALSGGSMPQTLSGLATSTDGHDVDWARVWVFFSDERCVPLDHEDSNYKACASALLDKLPIPKDHIVALDASLPSAEAMARDYEQRMVQVFSSGGEPQGAVQFDAILLGMGPDGHTASLFPGHPLLQEQGAQVAPITDSPKPPPERITLTFPVLDAAREVMFIAAGGSKASLFQEAFYAEEEGAAQGTVSIRPGLPYPAFQVRPAAGALYWYTDAAGSTLLPEEVKGRARQEPAGKL